MRRELVRWSKFLSLVLRHDPSLIGIELDAGGWVGVDVLLAALEQAEPEFTRTVLEEIVATNEKRRFTLSADRRRIRAAQGHSLGLDLGLPAVRSPDRLFHGTAERNLTSIREVGLLPRKRDFVHLSADAEAAREVGARHGRPNVLRIDAARMWGAGHVFHVAANGVWLTRGVPPDFIRGH